MIVLTYLLSPVTLESYPTNNYLELLRTFENYSSRTFRLLLSTKLPTSSRTIVLKSSQKFRINYIINNIYINALIYMYNLK